MSEQETFNQDPKTNFVKSYGNFKTIEDIPDIVSNLVIPNFEVLACDLSEVIDEINKSYSIQSESMDFIELVFNPNLYQVMLEQMDNTKDQYIHYLIVLVEFTKMEKYMEMKSRLDTILSDGKISNTILSDGIKQASEERITNCKERISSIIADLKINYSSFVLSVQGINMLLESNGLVL
jgi:hypothetical protein